MLNRLSRVFVPALGVIAALLVQDPSPETTAAWRERLFFPEHQFDMQVTFTVDDLLGETRLEPEERVRAARDEVVAGRDGWRPRLDLAHALGAASDRVESLVLLETLRDEIGEHLRTNQKDWSALAILGEVGKVHGFAFRDNEALEAGHRFLSIATDRDPTLWRASLALADLYFRSALGTRDPDETRQALMRARGRVAEAIEASSDELEPYALRFMIGWIEAVRMGKDDPDGVFDAVLARVDELKEAAASLDDGGDAPALADLLACTMIVARCTSEPDPFSAYPELDESIRDRFDGLLENLEGLLDHRQFAGKAAVLRWALVLFAGDEREAAFLAEGIEASSKPAKLLAAKVGLEAERQRWEAAESALAALRELVDDASTDLLAGRVAGAKGDFEASLAYYRSALAKEAGLAVARTGVAVARLKLGHDAGEVVPLLEEVVGGPEPPTSAVFALGTALALRAKYEEAVTRLDEAIVGAKDRRKTTVRETLDEVLELADG